MEGFLWSGPGGGFDPVVVVYVRRQSEFLESLYAETIKHGSEESFSDELYRVLCDGSLVDPYGQRISFRYDEYLECLADETSSKIMCFNYDALSEQDGVIPHFFREVLGLGLLLNRNTGLFTEMRQRQNNRIGLHSICALKLLNCVKCELIPSVFSMVKDSVLEATYALDQHKFRGLSDEQRQLIIEKFSDSNQRLKQRWSIDIADPGFGKRPDEITAPLLQRVSSLVIAALAAHVAPRN